MRPSSPTLAVIAAIVAAPALAAPAPGPNGGTVAVYDGHPIEFVATDAGVTFFLSDEDGKPIDTAAVTAAKAFVTVGGKTQTLALRPVPPNRLAADLQAPLPAGAKVVLSARIHGHALQARFAR